MSSPFRYGLSKITGDEGIQRTPTIEDIAAGDSAWTRTKCVPDHGAGADQGRPGMARRSCWRTEELFGACDPNGPLAGKGKTLLETGLSPRWCVSRNRGVQQTGTVRSSTRIN